MRDERQLELERGGEVGRWQLGQVRMGRLSEMGDLVSRSGGGANVLLDHAGCESHRRRGAGVDEVVQFLHARSALDGADGLDGPDLGGERDGEGFDLAGGRDGLAARGGADDLLDQGDVVEFGVQAGGKRGEELAEIFQLVERGGGADDLDSQESRGGVDDGLNGVGVVAGNGDVTVNDGFGLGVCV